MDITNLNKRKNKNIVYKFIRFLGLVLFMYIMFLLIFIDTKVNYVHILKYKFNNYIVIISLLIFIFLFKILWEKIKNKNIKYNYINIVISILFVCLLIFQIIVINSIFFETDWDVSHLMYAARNFNKTGIFADNFYYFKYPYFSVYPNNLFITFIFSLIMKIGNLLNINDGYKLCVYIGTILVDITGIYLSKVIYNMTKNKLLQLISYIIYILLIGISPWYMIPYTDTYAILFTTLVLYNYTKINKNHFNYIGIGIFAYLGFLIKPTSIIILIAIIIIEFYLFWFRKNKFNIKNIKSIILILLGIFIVFIGNIGIQKYISYKQDKNYNFSIYHYLMMGTNQETLGTYSDMDVLLSLNIDNYKDRIDYNKKVFLERFNNMTFIEKIKFYSKKMLINYNDGTFAWGCEGVFFLKVNNYNNVLTSLYYNDGINYSKFSTFSQIIWLFVLLMVFLELIIDFNYSKYKSVIILSIIGLTMFILVFEARARYLYIYLPYYIILAVLGINNLFKLDLRTKYKGVRDGYNKFKKIKSN